MAKTVWSEVVEWGEDAEAFFGSLIKSETATIAPIAQQSFDELATAEATALATGDAKDTGHILAGVVASTTAKMATAGISASPASVAIAVGAVVAKASANAAKSS